MNQITIWFIHTCTHTQCLTLSHVDLNYRHYYQNEHKFTGADTFADTDTGHYLHQIFQSINTGHYLHQVFQSFNSGVTRASSSKLGSKWIRKQAWTGPMTSCEPNAVSAVCYQGLFCQLYAAHHDQNRYSAHVMFLIII